MMQLRSTQEERLDLGKGAINNQITNHLMQLLAKQGIPTHFVAQLSETETAVKAVRIIPLEVIVRSIAAGSLSQRLGLAEGTKLASTVLEFCYKRDDLGDPLVNSSHIKALGLATEEELALIKRYSLGQRHPQRLPCEGRHRIDRLQAGSLA
jgi:phosphoribosylaminoimidazole-succinocarboxamide synthase